MTAVTDYANHYRCPACGAEWYDTWDCGVDMECPACEARDISPVQSMRAEELFALATENAELHARLKRWQHGDNAIGTKHQVKQLQAEVTYLCAAIEAVNDHLHETPVDLALIGEHIYFALNPEKRT